METIVTAAAFASILFVTPEGLATLGAGGLIGGLVGGLCGKRHTCHKRSGGVVDCLFQYNATGLSGQDMKVLNGMIAQPLGGDKAIFHNGDSFMAEGTMTGIQNKPLSGVRKGGLSITLPSRENATIEGTWIIVDPSRANDKASAAFAELHEALSPVSEEASQLSLVQTIEMLAK